jgi:hypothetical protein
MRKFQITAPSFSGFVIFVYNADGFLEVVDVSNATLDLKQVDYIFHRAPLMAESLEHFCSISKLECIEAEYEVTFDMFWERYNYKVEKKRTRDLWNKMSKMEQFKAFSSIAAYERFLKRKQGLEKKYPDTYLRKESFETEWDKIK